MNRFLIPVVVAAGLAVASCGKQGYLDQPAPLFGAKAKADYEAKQQAAKSAAAKPSSAAPASDQADDSAPSRFDKGAIDPALNPSRSAPTPGEPPDPAGTTSGGVLPDPYADPNHTPR